MASIFSRIVNGEIPCHKVAETEDFLAFLDIRPLTRGHTLVIPKKEVDYIFELDDERYIGLFVFSREIARAIERTVTCERIGIAVIGLEVPHCHIHLVPINAIGDLNFQREPLSLSPEELAALAVEIRGNLNS
jgi:histidine triad (HIT) family protein